jgi:cell division protease FtsH
MNNGLDNNRKSPQNGFVIALAMGFMFFLFMTIVTNVEKKTNEIDFNAFIQGVKEKRVENVTFSEDHNITGYIKDKNEPTKSKAFHTIGDTHAELYLKLMYDNDIIPNYKEAERPSFILMLIMNCVPILLMFLIGWFLLSKLQSGIGSARSSIGGLRQKSLIKTNVNVTFKDVAGVDEAKEELKEIVEFLKDPQKFSTLGGRLPKGALLVGPPGTGKTLLARAVAGEAQVPFFSISGSHFVEMFVGVGASRVRDLFEQAKANAPCIIFIDEIDSIGKHRGSGAYGGGNDEREQTLNQLLVEMDGFDSSKGIILIGATNRPDTLDPALLRPGRFDRRVFVSLPDVKGREQILRTHTEGKPLTKGLDLAQIAKGTAGLSGAELENLVNEAAIFAARLGKKEIEIQDFEKAKDKILMGVERKSLVISQEEKRVTAYHEAGHTLISKLIKGLDPFHKVSIIPRGQALGITQSLPDDNQLSLTKEKAENMIAMLMGGRVAEEIKFKHLTTGASNDLERATGLARRMVCEWGMSDSLGPITFNDLVSPKFGEMATNYSSETLKKVEAEINEIIQRNYNKAKKILMDNNDLLIKLSETLLEKETLDNSEVDAICNQSK